MAKDKYACMKHNTVPMPVDPVCGIEMDQELAVPHEHNGKTYYFCCEGCKRIFVKKPNKYSKK